MPPRPYCSPRRAAAAQQTRRRILDAAAVQLRQSQGIGAFSLEGVGRAAGVTRPTVYNQFGSRRTLLEAVFDDLAARGGLHRLGAAMGDPDAGAGLRRLIAIFCDFWSFDHALFASLYNAGGADAEFEESLQARNQRRRHALAVLVGRLVDGEGKTDQGVRDELVDILFAVTSFQFFRALSAGHRSADEVRRMIEQIAADAVRRFSAPPAATTA